MDHLLYGQTTIGKLIVLTLEKALLLNQRDFFVLLQIFKKWSILYVNSLFLYY